MIAGSSVITGKIENIRPEWRPFTEDEFKAALDSILGGAPITHSDITRCTKPQLTKMRSAVFLDALHHCNGVFKIGQHRGRHGAAKVLDLCRQIIELHEPEAEGQLHVLDEIIRALGECNTGALPELFRPGVDANDHRAHLSIVKDNADG
jgi:hypothetical protein